MATQIRGVNFIGFGLSRYNEELGARARVVNWQLLTAEPLRR